MTDHSGLLDRYRRMREVRFRLNNLLVKTIPKKTLEECGRILGFFRKGTLFFESEDETSVLMDYCLYYPGPTGATWWRSTWRSRRRPPIRTRWSPSRR